MSVGGVPERDQFEQWLNRVRSNDWDDFCLEAFAEGHLDRAGYHALMALNPFD